MFLFNNLKTFNIQIKTHLFFINYFNIFYSISFVEQVAIGSQLKINFGFYFCKRVPLHLFVICCWLRDNKETSILYLINLKTFYNFNLIGLFSRFNVL